MTRLNSEEKKKVFPGEIADGAILCPKILYRVANGPLYCIARHRGKYFGNPKHATSSRKTQNNR